MGKPWQVAECRGDPGHGMMVPLGLLWRLQALRQTQERLHPAPQRATRLPNLLALPTSSHSRTPRSTVP